MGSDPAAAIALGLAAWLAIAPGAAWSQAAAPTGPPAATQNQTQAGPEAAKAKSAPPVQTPVRPPVSTKDRRRAAKLFLDASKLYEKERFQEARKAYQEAARLDPEVRDYALAADVARSHAVQALMQTAAKARLMGDSAAERKAIEEGLVLEPDNTQLKLHLDQLAVEAEGVYHPRYEERAAAAGEGPKLEIHDQPRSFHLHQSARQVIQEMFRAYGLEATVDSSVRSAPIHMDLDDVGFEKATQVLGMATQSFYVPLDGHRVLVARDTRENRQSFERQDLETVYLPGLTQEETTSIVNLAKNVFEIPQAAADASAGTITVRGPTRNLEAYNATLRQLLDGRSQVMLDVRIMQLARTRGRNTGAILPQNVTAFNLYSEARNILNQNQSLVQEIIQEGLASPGDTLKILMLLIESGQVSSNLLSSGFAIFGGGITLSALEPGPLTMNLALNSSETRDLENLQLRLGDGEATTLRSGSRYPIQTSSYSSLASSRSGVTGLTSPGTSSGLAGASSNSVDSSYNVPQVEYQDLGLTFKATPKVMRDDLVALTLDMKIDALSGGSVNGNPILNNRAYSGVVTLKPGESAVLVSELDKSQSRAITGTSGLSEIPGMNNLTGKDAETNYASLLIVVTPQVVRGIGNAGRSPMMRIERSQAGR